MTEPTTAAGRALLGELVNQAGKPNARLLREQVRAIEAEARQQDGSAHSEFPTATPRPWTVDTLEGGGWAVVVDADGEGAKVIAELDDTYGDRAANAALIVEAVNALTALPPSAPPAVDVEALAAVLRYSPMHWEVRRPDGAFVMTRMFESADEAAAYIAAEYARLEPER